MGVRLIIIRRPLPLDKQRFRAKIFPMELAGFLPEFFDEIDSTNSYVSRHFDELPHHSLIYAGIQTLGRGRLSREWDSSARGNLYMSLLIKDPQVLKAAAVANFTQLMALSAVRALRNLGVRAGIKWPNDIFAASKISGDHRSVGRNVSQPEAAITGKLGGILSEGRFSGDRVRGVIIGLGLNLAGAPVLPADSPYRAVSVADLLPPGQNHPIDVEQFLPRILGEYSALYPDFCREGFASFAGEYQEALLFTDKPLRIEADGFKDEYRFAGLGEGGGLLLKSMKGETVELHAGDIRWEIF